MKPVTLDSCSLARATKRRRLGLTLPILLLLCVGLTGCRRAPETTASVAEPTKSEQETPPQEASPSEPLAYEITADDLLGARLSPEEVAEGWIQLFDGHTLFGWEIAGNANFRVEDGSIVVDQGDVCLLCTSIPWRDYELVVEFKAQEKTNSGVFLRTLLDPEDVETDCYEVNIAPSDNPFPTAGIVKRQRAEGETAEPYDVWRTMSMRMEGNHLQVSLDGRLVNDYTDPAGVPDGRIGLQHNSGRVEFRKVMLKPIGFTSLLDENLTRWTQYPDMDAKFTVNESGQLHIEGGSGQLETKDSFGNFVLLAEYKLPAADINSGIFFRSIPGDKMMGYECQLSNEMKDDNPLTPADCGTGGIFRRQDARVIAGEVDQWATVVLAAQGPTMAAWVNGVQVSDWYDTRDPDENPRRGRRDDPGTIILQGHDPKTDALLKQFQIINQDELP